jgi:hypothetical protein
LTKRGAQTGWWLLRVWRTDDGALWWWGNDGDARMMMVAGQGWTAPPLDFLCVPDIILGRRGAVRALGRLSTPCPATHR